MTRYLRELVKTEPVAGKPVEEMTNAELWAVETLVTITQDEIEYARMSNLIKSQLDYQSGMVNAKRKGRIEGRAEGRNEGMLEVARKMKSVGRPLSEIMEFTGLPAETIEQV